MRYDEFKIYLDDDKQNLAFHAYIANVKYYRILQDLNNLYTELFLDIIHGNYSIDYISSSDYLEGNFRKQQFRIENDNVFVNLNAFHEAYDIHGYVTEYNVNVIENYFTMTFDGLDYGMEQGMSLDAIRNATSLTKSLYVAANNRNYNNAFQEEPKASSLKLGISATRFDTFGRDVLSSLLSDIHFKRIDFSLIDALSRDLYKKLLNKLAQELKNFKNLHKLTINIDDHTYNLDDFAYIYEKADEVYGEPITFERAIVDSLSSMKNSPEEMLLKVDVQNGDREGYRINCHFNKSDFEDLTNLYMAHGKEINLEGISTSPRTILLQRYNFPPAQN